MLPGFTRYHLAIGHIAQHRDAARRIPARRSRRPPAAGPTANGRMSPDLRSDRNGSRPPPSYEKTSRTSTGAAVLSRLALSGFAAAAGVGSSPARRALVARRGASGGGGEQGGDVPGESSSHRAPPAAILRRRRGRRRRRLHERADPELRLEQRAQPYRPAASAPAPPPP